VIHKASPKFWSLLRELPEDAQRVAHTNFSRLKADPRHPSLHFKKVGRLWSARVGDHYRALAVQDDGGSLVWFWIGSHAEYDALLKRL